MMILIFVKLKNTSKFSTYINYIIVSIQKIISIEKILLYMYNYSLSVIS